MADSKIAVIGIGNLLMSDEGVGVHVVNQLEKKYTFNPEIEIIDGGTSGSELLQFFEDNDKVLIVDAVNFEKEPGFIGIIENDDIFKRLTTKLSMHHLGLTDVLSHVKLLEREPEQTTLIGIQPDSMELSTELSDTIENKLDTIFDMMIDKLMNWDIECIKK